MSLPLPEPQSLVERAAALAAVRDGSSSGPPAAGRSYMAVRPGAASGLDGRGSAAARPGAASSLDGRDSGGARGGAASSQAGASNMDSLAEFAALRALGLPTVASGTARSGGSHSSHPADISATVAAAIARCVAQVALFPTCTLRARVASVHPTRCLPRLLQCPDADGRREGARLRRASPVCCCCCWHGGLRRRPELRGPWRWEHQPALPRTEPPRARHPRPPRERRLLVARHGALGDGREGGAAGHPQSEAPDRHALPYAAPLSSSRSPRRPRQWSSR